MADALSQILEQQSRNSNAALQQAAHNAAWSNTFSNTPPAQVLQDNNTLHDMVGNAIDQKQRAMAQSDAKAMAAYVANQKLLEYQRQAPLREQILQEHLQHEKAMTDAIGAHDRFIAQKNTQVAQDVAAMANDAAQMKSKAGTPEHEQEITALLANHPDAMTTKAGQEIVKQLSQSHNDVVSMTPPPGTVLSHMEVNEDGKQKAVFKPAPTTANPQQAFEDALAASHPVYGTSTNGKDFTPTVAGAPDVNQTHVQTQYVLPNGKLSPMQVLPRVMFDNAVAASQARAAAVTGAASGTTAPTTAAPDGSDLHNDATGMSDAVTPMPIAGAPAATAAVNPGPPIGGAAPAQAQSAPDIHQQAFQALQSGAPREAVFQRLKQLGGFKAKVLQLESDAQQPQAVPPATPAP